jgi:hypothetical protein
VRRYSILILSLVFAACGSSSRPTAGGSDGGGADGGGADGGGDTACATDEEYFVPGCGSGEDVTITAGCYRPCEPDGAAVCEAPTTCQRTDINPCVCPPGAGCCAACGAEQWLCLPSDPGGTDPYELSSLDEACEGLLSGRDVLDSMNESYDATLTYNADGSTTGLALRFTYADGAIVCHPAVPAPPGSAAPDQPAYLEVEVSARVTTEDGSFIESGMTMLSSGSPDSPVDFNITFAVADLTGTYVPQLTDLTDHAVWFAGTASLTGASGLAMEGGTRAGGVGEVVPVGSFAAP